MDTARTPAAFADRSVSRRAAAPKSSYARSALLEWRSNSAALLKTWSPGFKDSMTSLLSAL